MKKTYGAVELGGTHSRVIIAKDQHNILAQISFPTSSPEITLDAIISFFKDQSYKLKIIIESIGIGSFGPIDLDMKSETFGYITSTPKPGWQFTNVKGKFEEAMQIPAVFDTDVNAAAYGEYLSLRAQKINNLAYITIGTGIGAGLIINKKLVHGLIHPEFGHIHLSRDINTDPFKGVCPFHGGCFEGLASGPAIHERWGVSPETLSVDHDAWELESKYISQALVNLIFTISPEKIILGGGVMHQTHLFNRIHKKTNQLLNDYIQSDLILNNINKFIIPPTLGEKSGIIGALELAQNNPNAVKGSI